MTSYTLADLERADHQVAEGEQHIARQGEIIVGMCVVGRDIADSQRHLTLFNEAQQQRRAHRDAIAKAIAK